MAHNPIFGPDPGKPAFSAAKRRAESGAVSPAAGTVGESDLAELTARFAAHGGGRVSPELSADLALEIVLNEIVEQACLATGAGGAAIVLERGGEWVCRASAGGNAPQLGARLDTEAGLSGACVKTRTVQRCDDAQEDPRADVEACRILGVRSVVILPLLQNDELAGIFEVFSSSPSAFGERDERTLEALSQRVLRNLKRASEPMSVEVERSKGPQAAVENPIPPSDVASIASSSAASDGNQGSLDQRLPQAAGETASGRGINVTTWVLGAAVLGYAVLLTVLVAQHLGEWTAARAHPAVVSAPLAAAQKAGAENQTAAAGAVTSVTSGNQSAGNRSSPPRAGSLSVAPIAGASRATDSSPPAGGLRVYENGKEVFRMPPVGNQGEAINPAGRNGNGATSTNGDEPEMQPASAVEPARILEVSPEVAEGSLMRRVEPDYPEEARRQQMQGPVVLDVRTDRDGIVEEVKLLSGPRVLADAAIAAVKQWRFRPHMVNGQAVEMQTQVTLNFKLSR